MVMRIPWIGFGTNLKCQLAMESARLCCVEPDTRFIPMSPPHLSRSQLSPVSRRRFISRMSLGAAALATAPYIRAQPATPKKLGIALVGLGSYSHGQLAPAL